MQNAAGQFVSPEDDSFKAAAAGADWAKSFYQILTNQPGKESWPISGATFILMHKSSRTSLANATEVEVLCWATRNGDKTAADLDYVPMPKP
jgi:phosphate transport system substrate-binding protein